MDVVEQQLGKEYARVIMGRNYFGVEDAIRHFKVRVTNTERGKLAKVPYTVETLRKCKDTHILVAEFPLSVLELRQRKTDLFNDRPVLLQGEEAFDTTPLQLGWRLIQKRVLEGSGRKDWDGQCALLSANEEPASAASLLYMAIGHQLAHGGKLFSNLSLRTASKCRLGYPVIISLKSYGWAIDLYERSESSSPNLFIVPAIKPQST